MMPVEYKQLRRDYPELKLPLWPKLSVRSKKFIKRNKAGIILRAVWQDLMSGTDRPRVYEMAEILTADFAQFFIDQCPKFDQLILEDIRRADKWAITHWKPLTA